jgi:UDP-N-acetylglucosamine 2-epimerase (non-hydrolysing)
MRPECTDRYILPRMPHVLTVFGTRPEAVKLAPVVLELQRRAGASLVSHVCVTAQHRDMLDQVLRVFNIVPDVDLNVMADNQSPTQVASAVLARLEPILKELRPDWVVVQGDTTTVALAALAAFYARVRVAHVEAGLRTSDKWQPFPEEINRRIAGVIADLHLAPTARARDNLLREGVSSERILVTGNPGIDALRWVTRQLTPPDVRARFAAWGLDDASDAPRLVLVTAHRRENFGAGLEQICLALRDLARRYQGSVRIVYPVHRNPHVWESVHRLLGDEPWVTLVAPLDYLPNLHLMRRATLVLTDSGGVQEEAPGLGVPALVLRDVTERPEGVEAGALRLVGTDRERIVAEATRLLDDPQAYRSMARAVNPFGDGYAAERIVSALLGEPVDEFDGANRILTA